jgi:Mg-chelatase subunit ChlD
MRGYFLLCFLFSLALKAQLSFSDRNIDLGSIAEAYEIKGDVVLKNPGDKKIFLLRADAENGVKIFTTKKTLAPGDTALLVISFIPESSGRFNKKIKLVSSDAPEPYELRLSGNLNKLKKDDKLACFYFGSHKNSSVKVKEPPVQIPEEPVASRDKSNKIPDHSAEPAITYTPPAPPGPEKAKSFENKEELPRNEFLPNNLLFLVDVSSSMRDSLKLPLMKEALYTLIDAVRDIDSITFVTYSDSVRILRENVSGKEKDHLKQIVQSLKAKGVTKGRQAIFKSLTIAQSHYIKGGNNQIFLASDGQFPFSNSDYEKWVSRQGNKKVVLSTIAFGDEREAMKNLKELADKGDGSFIHIKRREGSEDKLLEEVKRRSRKP